MNHIYPLNLNDAVANSIGTAEATRSAGKETPSGLSSGLGRRDFVLRTLIVSLMMGFGSTLHALPAAGVVAAGSASIVSSGAGSLTITQASQNAAFNWQSFNIGASEAVRFIQPNSNSVALNRVLGSDPSAILGSLTANGKVFLINPNGILFGTGASVNVGGLVASTLGITDNDFMAGRYRFTGTGTGTVNNKGNILALDGGFIAMLGERVGNDGMLSAKLGTIVLAAGSAVTMNVVADGLVNVTVDQGTLNALVKNGGLIQADGGSVLMTAQARDALLSTVVNNQGIVQANSIGHRNGRIILDGGDTGVVDVSGELRAQGAQALTTGGTINVVGDKVGIAGTAVLDASGAMGGGTVLVGGDYQGKNPSIHNAEFTYVGPQAVIKADATQVGDGGKVIVWANDRTNYQGFISARGGTNGGDGGFVEVSGKNVLGFSGLVDTRAPLGMTGTLLLDPTDITISTAPDTGTMVFGSVSSLFFPISYSDVGPVALSNLNTVTLQNHLLLSSVFVDTLWGAGGAGDITIVDNITWSSANNLGLNAVNNITVNAGVSITNTGGANIDFVSSSPFGTILINLGASISTGGVKNFIATTVINLNPPSVITLGSGSVIEQRRQDVIGLIGVSQPIDASPRRADNASPGFSPLGAIDNANTAAPLGPDASSRQDAGTAQGNPTETSSAATASAVGAGASNSVPVGTATASSSSGPSSIGASAKDSGSPSTVPPGTSNFKTSGLVSKLFAGNTAPDGGNARIKQPAFFKGAAKAEQVGTTSSGVVLLATLGQGGNTTRLAVTVAVGDGFKFSLPKNLAGGNVATPDRATLSGGAPLPTWLTFNKADSTLVAGSVPPDGLPLTISLGAGPGKKSVEVTFK